MADPESFEGFMQALGVAIVILFIASILWLNETMASKYNCFYNRTHNWNNFYLFPIVKTPLRK